MKKKIAIILTVLILATTWFLVQGVPLFFNAPLPLVDKAACEAIRTAAITEEDGVKHLGASYAFSRQGVDACYLEGLPEVRGADMARLYAENFALAEQSLVDTVKSFIPNATLRWVMARLVMIRNRGLAAYVPQEIQAELAGLTLASPDQYPQYGDYFNRLLNYLAAHDISHAYMDYMFMACTAFGLDATRTATHTPLLARNFDFEAGPAFDDRKLVMLIQPAQGLRFISVAWPGMVGVVSGMNEAGIAVVLLAGHSQDKPGIGAPVSVVAREVLTQAHTLDEAVAVVQKARVFVSESFMIGSGQENAFVVVEKTPQRTEVRPMQNHRIESANHFLSPAFSQDKANLDYETEGTSVARLARLQQRLNGLTSPADVAMCVDILRDRQGIDNQPLGLGNRSAINPLIASHSVVFDLQRRIAWVSAAPHQLGNFVPFGMDDFAQTPDAPFVPADALLENRQYGAYLEYNRELDRAKSALKKKQYAEAQDICARISALNPDDYQVYYVSAQALSALGKKAEALQAYRKALAGRPAFGGERKNIEAAIKTLQEVTHE